MRNVHSEIIGKLVYALFFKLPGLYSAPVQGPKRASDEFFIYFFHP